MSARKPKKAKVTSVPKAKTPKGKAKPNAKGRKKAVAQVAASMARVTELRKKPAPSTPRRIRSDRPNRAAKPKTAPKRDHLALDPTLSTPKLDDAYLGSPPAMPLQISAPLTLAEQAEIADEAAAMTVLDKLMSEHDPLVAQWSSPDFTPSPQQATLFQWIKEGEGNAFVEAVAGSGKTTSLTQGCRFMQGSVVLTCFNRKIAAEARHKMEWLGLKNVEVATFHSLGMRACKRAYPGTKVDDKIKRDAMFDALKGDLQQFPDRWRGPVARLVSLAKQSACYLFWQPQDLDRWRAIIDKHDIEEDMEVPSEIDICIDYAMKGLSWSKRIALQMIDFDDMIWLPIITPMKVQQFDWVLVDESQDTNPARRAFAEKMTRLNTGRMAFVGDRHQAIYGFTGADNDAVDLLIKDFKCKTLPLTVTYRCPQLVVKEAQKYVSHIVAHPNNPPGIVRNVGREEFAEKELTKLAADRTLWPTTAILCRNTRPLVSLAFQMIRKNIGCHVEGRDIGQGLIKLAKRWKVKTVDALHKKLDLYLEHETHKLELKKQETKIAALNDKVETLKILMEGCSEVFEVIGKIESLFADTDSTNKTTVTLSTVHKAKGREWPTVYILGFNKYMPAKMATQAWEREQEQNIIYVAITRAQNELVYTDALED